MDSDEIRRNYDDAYACVELLLSAGADIYPEIVQSAGVSDVADIIYHYDITIKSEVYNFIKRSMGKCSLNVHNQLVAAVSRHLCFLFDILSLDSTTRSHASHQIKTLSSLSCPKWRI